MFARGLIRVCSSASILTSLVLGSTRLASAGYSDSTPESAGIIGLGSGRAWEMPVSWTRSVVFGVSAFSLQDPSLTDALQILLISNASNFPDNQALDPRLSQSQMALAWDDSNLIGMRSGLGQPGRLANPTTREGPMGWLTLPGKADLASPIDRDASLQSRVTVGCGLFAFAAFGLGRRRIRRFVRSVNRGPGRRRGHRYYY